MVIRNEWKVVLYFILCNFGFRIIIFSLHKIDWKTTFLDVALCLLFVACFWCKDLMKYFKAKDCTIVMKSTESKATIHKVYLMIVIIILSSAFYYCFFGKIKVIYLLQNHLEMYGYIGVLSFVIQILYFVTEILTMVTIVKLVPLRSNLSKFRIEWGGLFLALTWGVSHFFTGSSLTGKIMTDFAWNIDTFSQYNLYTGIYYLVICIFLGIICASFKNNFKYAMIFSVLIYLI